MTKHQKRQAELFFRGAADALTAKSQRVGVEGNDITAYNSGMEYAAAFLKDGADLDLTLWDFLSAGFNQLDQLGL